MTDDGIGSGQGGQGLAGETVLWALGCAGVFVLPWRVWPGPRVYSASHVLGFNNRVALVCALGCVALLTARRLLAHRGGPESDVGHQDALDFSGEAVARVAWHHSGSFWAKSAWTVVYCGVLWVWAGMVPEAGWGESGYVVSRLELVLMGLLPYRDFQFYYGPLFLLVPASAVWLSGGRIGPGAAHTLALVAFTGAGLAMLSFALRGLLRQSQDRALAFWLLALGSSSLTLGLNYTLVRFAFPYAALVVGHRLWARGRRGAQAWTWATLSPLLGLAISPEVGIATWVGVAASCAAWSVVGQHGQSRSKLLGLALAGLAGGGRARSLRPRSTTRRPSLPSAPAAATSRSTPRCTPCFSWPCSSPPSRAWRN